ncbi:MAG: hypothetical protein WCJ66_13205 [Verrucomicrobiota bacterium]
MKSIPPEEQWQRFAAAARQQQQAADHPQPACRQAPAGFVARVVARAMQARREFLALLWQRWSWRLALATAAAAVVVGGFALRHKKQLRLDVPSSTLEIPPL